MFHVPEKYRFTKEQGAGEWSSDPSYGNNGVFFVPIHKKPFKIIASDGEGWEHVSVSLKGRTPYWHEMCAIKDVFWDSEDCVIQYHPPKAEYVNSCGECLHLWRSIEVEILRPPVNLV